MLLPKPLLIQLADGSAIVVSEYVAAQMVVGEVICDFYCLAIGEDADIDFIVGISWLRRHRAKVCFRNDTIKLYGMGGHSACPKGLRLKLRYEAWEDNTLFFWHKKHFILKSKEITVLSHCFQMTSFYSTVSRLA